MDSGSIHFLRVSDFNTTGLLGSDKEYNTQWCNLTKSSGTSDKAGTSGGSFGIGKFAPFACSDLRTVFYSTLDTEGLAAFQGISRITSFRINEDRDITIGVGFYGAPNNMPVYAQLKLDPSFCRNNDQTGTDIFIAGFKYYSTEWKTDIIASVLDGFLDAVFRGSLVVRVDDVVINKETLPSLIEEYKNFLMENADKYYTVLTSKETVWHTTDFKNYGNISLGLIIQADMHRKVAMIRKTGMKIMDRGNISGIIPFAGVMLIEGEKINDFLRCIENPQHMKWEPERAANPMFAKMFIRDLVVYIKDRLDELKLEDASEEIDPSVGEYLPDEIDQDPLANTGQSEALPDTIKSFETTIVTKKPSQKISVQNGDGSTMDDKYGDFTDEDFESGSGHGEGESSNGGASHGENEGQGTGPNPVEHQKTLSAVVATKVRSVCLDKSKGEYSITFVPSVSVENSELAIYLCAESQNYDAVIKSAMAFGQDSIMVKGNRIYGLAFTANTPVRIKITIDYYDYCSLEVKAYGNKV